MNCSQIESCLDALMDDALDDDQLRKLEEHALNCAECANKLKAARQLKAMFAQMAPEMDVPLSAQAKWRGAVKVESKRASARRVYRYAAAMAAALVVALISVLALRPDSVRTESMADAPMLAESTISKEVSDVVAQGAIMIEADGLYEGEAAALDTEAEDYAAPLPMHEVTLTVSDLDQACAYISDLVNEYEGSLDAQRYEAEGAQRANLYIGLSAEDAAEFLNAASHLDAGGKAQLTIDAGAGDKIALLMVLRTE